MYIYMIKIEKHTHTHISECLFFTIVDAHAAAFPKLIRSQARTSHPTRRRTNGPAPKRCGRTWLRQCHLRDLKEISTSRYHRTIHCAIALYVNMYTQIVKPHVLYVYRMDRLNNVNDFHWIMHIIPTFEENIKQIST